MERKNNKLYKRDFSVERYLAPKTEAPKTETPKTEAPKTETPKTEAPKISPLIAYYKSELEKYRKGEC